MAEFEDERRPSVEIFGRWKADPVRLIGELSIAKDRIARIAYEERDATGTYGK